MADIGGESSIAEGFTLTREASLDFAEACGVMVFTPALRLPVPVSSTPPVVACYSVTFDYYQAVDGPQRVECPATERPVTPPPAPPGPTVDPFAGG